MGRPRVVTGALVILTAATVTRGQDALCYYDAGKAAPPEYIPCAEPKNGLHHHCCKRGNKCMEKSTCFDFATYVTYQIGCSDPSYKDSSCPDKCGLGLEKSIWVGLVLCNDKEWACNHPDTCGKKCAPNEPWNDLIQTLPAIACSDLRPRKVAFTAGSRLIDRTTLPVVGLPWSTSEFPSPSSSPRESETQTATHNAVAISSDVESAQSSGPSETAAATATATASAPFSTATDSTATETASREPNREATIEDNSDTKALAISLGAGLPLLFALAGGLLYLFFRRRRRSKSKTDSADPGSATLDRKSGPHNPPDTDPDPLSLYTKSELPADEPSRRHELHSPSLSMELPTPRINERSPAAFSPATTHRGSVDLRSPMSAVSTPFAGRRESSILEEDESGARPSGGYVYQAYSPTAMEARPDATGGLRILNEETDARDFSGVAGSPEAGAGTQGDTVRENPVYELPG